jgi:TRAP-type C4-dicarboxylate transport system substrate-binding protein
MRRYTNLFSALGAAVLIALTIPTANAVEWDMPTAQSATSLTGIADGIFSKALSEKTNGEINVTVHYGGSLGYKGKDHYDAVSTGAVVLADSYTGPFVGFDPIWQVSAIPFLTGSIDDAWLLYQATKKYYEAALAKDNQILLYTIPWTPSGIWANKSITTKADIENLKIRTFDPLGLMTFRAANAAPVTLGFSDVVPQLTTGGLDAVLTSEEGGFKNKFQDLLSHFVEINYASPLSVVHMNKDTWDGLSDSEKAAVTAAAKEAEEAVWSLAKTRVQENYKLMREAGITIVDDVPADFMDFLVSSSSDAINDWKAKVGERGDEVLKAYNDARAK